MLDGIRIPIIDKASRKLLEDSGPLLHFPQHESSRIRRDIATVEIRHYFSTTQSVKFDWFRFTLCHQKGRLRFGCFSLSQSLNATRGGLFWSFPSILSRSVIQSGDICGLAAISHR
jgi:hypothetical protein